MDLKDNDARKCPRCDVQLLDAESGCPACGRIVSRDDGRTSNLERAFTLLGTLVVPVFFLIRAKTTSLMDLDFEKALMTGLYAIAGGIGGWILGRFLEVVRGNR